MFLSKIGEVYYLFYTSESGERRKGSTRCRMKSDALKFLHDFKRETFEQKRHLKRT